MPYAVVDKAVSQEKIYVMRGHSNSKSVIEARSFQIIFGKAQAVGVVTIIEYVSHRLQVRAGERQNAAWPEDTVGFGQKPGEVSNCIKMLYHLVGMDQID